MLNAFSLDIGSINLPKRELPEPQRSEGRVKVRTAMMDIIT